MIHITCQGNTSTFEQKVQVLDLLPPPPHHYYSCLVDGRMRELTYWIEKDSTVEFLDLSHYDTVRLYDNSLRFLVTMALYRLYPEARVVFSVFVSQATLMEFRNLPVQLNDHFVAQLSAKMDDIIAANLPIKRITVSKDDAIAWYERHGYQDKRDIISYRPDTDAHFYECDRYSNYMFGYMVPSTGYLKHFNILMYYPHLVLQFPRSESEGKIPTFVDSPKLCKTVIEAHHWTQLTQGYSVAKLNQHSEDGTLADFINMCETRHNDRLSELGQRIARDRHLIRIIAVAGPSSSGKTTFTHRLRIELQTRGIKPMMISIDDYYKPKSECPVDEFGKLDLEHIEALDIDRFNHDLLALIQGQAVEIPHFDFKTGKRIDGHKIVLPPDTPILIEGIHALNERLTSFIPKYQKFKIYISPLPQINLDDHNPINTTDLRLLRRIVRDFRYRNTGALKTLEMWHSVRRGEYKWIYPFQEEADFIFNSELGYELGIMKKYALPLLHEIDPTSTHYIAANRLIKFLKYVKDIEDQYIPSNSILREFIGGSLFYQN